MRWQTSWTHSSDISALASTGCARMPGDDERVLGDQRRQVIRQFLGKQQYQDGSDTLTTPRRHLIRMAAWCGGRPA